MTAPADTIRVVDSAVALRRVVRFAVAIEHSHRSATKAHGTSMRWRRAQDFGLQALMLLPLTPLQSRSARQSALDEQTFTQVMAAPEIASQMEFSGHSFVEPEALQEAVQ